MEKLNKDKRFLIEEIKYNTIINCIEYLKEKDNIITGDQNGKLAIFDLRLNKAVKLINTGKSDMDIKY